MAKMLGDSKIDELGLPRVPIDDLVEVQEVRAVLETFQVLLFYMKAIAYTSSCYYFI